ncbi:MAG TPA: serine hydrolase domain-containing protein [Longimicrobium sp.]|nr:serine hydrolase domain-containing protein [Longimicrobium sp.]
MNEIARRCRIAGTLVAALLAACSEPAPVARVPPGPPGPVERFLTPAPAPVSVPAIEAAERLVRGGVERERFPGAALAIGNRGLIQKVEGFGKTSWADDAPAVSGDSTQYDLASLTKVVATTAAVMALVEDGKIELDAPVQRYLPRFTGGSKARVTIRHLLTHTAGARAGASDIGEETSRAQVLRYLVSRPLTLVPGEHVLYSDVGFVILWAAAESAAGEPLANYLRRRVWGPLEMHSTRVGVPTGCAACAPTLHLEEHDSAYTGGSYDEVARRLDGLAGNAGAFSTGRDLARFAAMIANEGRLGNVRVFARRTVRAFTRPQPGTGTRALGWEVYCREGVVPDQRECGEVYAFGHTGVTGTSLWINPDSRTWVVLLANRTYLPRLDVDMQAFRRRVYSAAIADSTGS